LHEPLDVIKQLMSALQRSYDEATNGSARKKNREKARICSLLPRALPSFTVVVAFAHANSVSTWFRFGRSCQLRYAFRIGSLPVFFLVAENMRIEKQ
jgi:hypothetical protein